MSLPSLIVHVLSLYIANPIEMRSRRCSEKNLKLYNLIDTRECKNFKKDSRFNKSQIIRTNVRIY